jgi:hypothetical protein
MAASTAYQIYNITDRRYIINRTALLLDMPKYAKTLNRRLELFQYIALAYAIHYTQLPHQSDSDGQNPNNPEIDSNVLTIFERCG